MQTTLFSQREGDEEMQITCNINVVIAFEDEVAGRYASAFYEHLNERLGDDFEFIRYQWSFSLLRDEGVRTAAAHDTSAADIVIIATHGDRELPEQVGLWFQQWVGRNAGPMALVALFDCPAVLAEARDKVRSALGHIAQAGGMDFFAEPDSTARGTETDFINRLAGKI
jgi:hypothetical protein